MAAVPPDSIHAIVTDPPYLLGFMGKAFDRQGGAHLNGRRMQEWHAGWAKEALRVLKPGGHMLAFGGTRTAYRLACALDDVGFEIRDTLTWAYGTGFPKSHDVSKAIDTAGAAPHGGEPPSPEALRWSGWGTALKPATEPIILARKPLEGPVAENVTRHGTGALNVDACRVGVVGGTEKANPQACKTAPTSSVAMGHNGGGVRPIDAGRWPANFLLSHGPDCSGADGCGPGCPVAELDRQSGFSRSPSRDQVIRRGARSGYAIGYGGATPAGEYRSNKGDCGGASRFFYVAKAAPWEREAGLEHLALKSVARSSGGQSRLARGEGPDATAGESIGFNQIRGARNTHPTVKPIRLMAYLVRLVTPPGGIVLDPFLGSGSTGIAAILEGRPFIGIEKEDEYAAIAEARMEYWAQKAGQPLADRVLGPETRRMEAVRVDERLDSEGATAGG
ncbi:MAG: DNA-methyltransferase [Thermoplasmatota archaeon]